MNQVVEHLGGEGLDLLVGGAVVAVKAVTEAGSWLMDKMEGLVAAEFPRFRAVVSSEADESLDALTAGDRRPWLTP